MSKELFMDAHEKAIEEYCEEHPNADWSTAYNDPSTADRAMVLMRERYADMVDEARDREKYK